MKKMWVLIGFIFLNLISVQGWAESFTFFLSGNDPLMVSETLLSQNKKVFQIENNNSVLGSGENDSPSGLFIPAVSDGEAISFVLEQVETISFRKNLLGAEEHENGYFLLEDGRTNIDFEQPIDIHSNEKHVDRLGKY